MRMFPPSVLDLSFCKDWVHEIHLDLNTSQFYTYSGNPHISFSLTVTCLISSSLVFFYCYSWIPEHGDLTQKTHLFIIALCLRNPKSIFLFGPYLLGVSLFFIMYWNTRFVSLPAFSHHHHSGKLSITALARSPKVQITRNRVNSPALGLYVQLTHSHITRASPTVFPGEEPVMLYGLLHLVRRVRPSSNILMPLRFILLPVPGDKVEGESMFPLPLPPHSTCGRWWVTAFLLSPSGMAFLRPTIRVNSSALHRQDAMLTLLCALVDKGQGQFSHFCDPEASYFIWSRWQEVRGGRPTLSSFAAGGRQCQFSNSCDLRASFPSCHRQ